MPEPSPYEVLGVSRDASPRQIKAAYWKLARRLHPDKNDGSRESTMAFEDLQVAYDTLRDPERRQLYDMQHPVREPPPPTPSRSRPKVAEPQGSRDETDTPRFPAGWMIQDPNDSWDAPNKAHKRPMSHSDLTRMRRCSEALPLVPGEKILACWRATYEKRGPGVARFQGFLFLTNQRVMFSHWVGIGNLGAAELIPRATLRLDRPQFIPYTAKYLGWVGYDLIRLSYDNVADVLFKFRQVTEELMAKKESSKGSSTLPSENEAMGNQDEDSPLPDPDHDGGLRSCPHCNALIEEGTSTCRRCGNLLDG